MLNSEWRKSSRSGPNDDNCVEARVVEDGSVQVRHSRTPGRATLWFTRDEWAAFLAGAQTGDFDLPE